MIAINLLSPQEKKSIKNLELFSTIQEVLFLILIFSAFAAIILVFANRFLQERLDGITAKNSSQIEVSQQINSQITAINQKINSTDKIQQNFKTWSKFITTVSNLRNNNTSYQSLAINYQNSLLEISGQSATREDLLAFKDNLDKSGLFTDIDLPITDLLPKEKNVFHIKATINLSKIK